MPRNLLIMLGSGAVVIGIAALYFANFGILTFAEPDEREIEGIVREVAESANLLSLRSTDGRDISLALVPETVLFDETGQRIAIQDIKQGFVIRALVKFNGLLAIPSVVRIIDSPRIILHTPVTEQTVSGKIYLTGRARVFENNVEYRVKDSAGVILAAGFTTATGRETGEYGEFQVAISYRATKEKIGTLEVFETSAESGSEIHKVTVPLRFISK